jgi:hypothetical protein
MLRIQKAYSNAHGGDRHEGEEEREQGSVRTAAKCRQGQRRAEKSGQEQTRADKSRHEQTRADKSRQEQTRADKSRQEQCKDRSQVRVGLGR